MRFMMTGQNQIDPLNTPRPGELEPGECELGGIDALAGPQELVGITLTHDPGLAQVRGTAEHLTLFKAAADGQTERVRWLLGCGADPRACEPGGLRPLDCAVRGGHIAVVDVLLAHDQQLLDLHGSDGRTALMAAVRGGHETLVRCLLGAGADARRWAADGTRALDLAAADGHGALVQLLLTHDPGLIDLPGRGEHTPLSAAAGGGHSEIVAELLRHGADSRREAADGTRPLDHAARCGHAAVVERLLRAHPGLLDLPGRAAETALMAAAGAGHAGLVQGLLARGADARVRACDGARALDLAARGGHLAVLDALLAHDPALLDLPGRTGHTALLAAATRGHTALVQRLLSAGACVDHRGADGAHALDSAAEAGHHAVVECLLAHEPALRDLPGRGERTALAAAAAAGHTGLVGWLLERGADARGCRSDGMRPLDAAARAGHAAVVEQLLAHDHWLLDMPGRGGCTALCAAAEGGHAGLVGALLSRGGDPRRRGEDGRHALEVAARYAHPSVIDVLLAHTLALRDLPGADGQTALAAAAAQGHAQLVGQLLLRGADPHVRDATGATALYWAARMGHPAVLTQLLEHDPSLLDAPVITAAGRLADLPRWLQPERSGMHQAQGLSLIELLILTRNAGIVLALLRRHRSRIHVVGLGGTTPLMLCAATAQSELLIWLLANGADPSRRDHAADHALLYALHLHATECARVLIEHDPALAHLPGQDGRTPAMLIGERLATAAAPALRTGPLLLQHLLAKAGSP